MPPDFTPSPLQRHVLAAGQSLSLHLAAGSTLYVQRGRMLLQEAPRWVGETVLRNTAKLAAGQAHALAHTGWVTLQAGPERSELWCCAPAAKSRTATLGWPFVKALWLTAVAAARGSGPRSAGGC